MPTMPAFRHLVAAIATPLVLAGCAYVTHSQGSDFCGTYVALLR